MLHVHHIDSLDLPELEPYRTMRHQLDHRRERIFVAEGEKVVRRLLESRFTVVSVLLPQEWLRRLETLLQARPEEIRAYVARKEVLEKLTGFSVYQGVLAIGQIPDTSSLDRILTAGTRPLLLAAVEGISNAENVGVIVRNCAAFGVQALLVGETSSSPFLRRAVRSSMGTIFQLPVIELASLKEALRELRERGVRCVAAHPHAEGRRILDVDFSGDCCIVFGSEGDGLSPDVLRACDEAAAISMLAQVDSLNVGSACAVFLYEANRQRGMMN